MPRYEITGPNGEKFEVNAPEGATNEQIMSFVKSESGIAAPPKPKPTAADKASSVGWSALQGISDPVFGASQFIAGAGSYASSLGGNYPNPVSEFFDGEKAAYTAEIQKRAAKSKEARDAAGFEGMDLSRLAGNILSPANIIPATRLAGKLGQGTSLAKGAATGFGLGVVGGAMAPVENTDNYAGEKFSQMALGGATSAIATPLTNILGSAISKGVKRAQNMLSRPSADDVIMNALADAGIEAKTIGAKEMASLRADVNAALKYGGNIDPAASLRKADFEALGMKGLKGQITGDPMQFAKEKNLAGIVGVGEPLTDAMVGQNANLANRINSKAIGAVDDDIASAPLLRNVQQFNRIEQGKIRAAYRAAEESAGAAADVPPVGLADDIARIADEHGGSIKELLNRFKPYGLYSDKIDDAATQTKVFNMREAEKLLKATNDYGNPMDRSSIAGIAKIQSALKKAIAEGADDGGPFAAPRALAREKFKLEDAVKALKDVANRKAPEDDFFNKYIIRGSPSQVKRLSEILGDDERKIVKTQLAARLQRAAFGEDLANRKGISPDRLARQLRSIGSTKMKAFFSDADIDEYNRIARVASYMETPPPNSAVNYSKSAAAIANNLSAYGNAARQAPILRGLSEVAKTYRDTADVNDALAGGLPSLSPLLSAKANKRLGLLSAGVGLGSGLALLGSN